MPQMADDDLRATVERKITANLPENSGSLSKDRIKALQYYRGEATGLLAKVEGQSGVVSRDVAEVIDSLLPSIMRVFASGDQTVQFEPQGPEDEQGAEQATDYANYVWSKDNPGFSNLQTWIKDGLLQRNGTVKIYWDETEKNVREPYKNLDPDQAAALKMDPDVTVVEEEEGDPGEPGPNGEPPLPTVNLVIRRSTKRGKITIKPVPPEEMGSELTYPGLDSDCPFCFHRYRSTRSDLIAQGYDKKLVAKIPTQNGRVNDLSGERQERLQPESSGLDMDEPADEANQEFWVAETYIRVDYDGDGYAELRQVVVAGDQADVILVNKEVDDNPFADWTPYLMPHKRYGESVADKVIDIQDQKTVLTRGLLNNLYRVNQPTRQVLKGKVEMEDVLSHQIGGILRVDMDGAVKDLTTPPVFQYAINGLEYIDTVREKRSGVTAYNQGLDANSLNKTASGINAIMGAANMRSELIARNFAEMGLVRAFKLILKLSKRHQDKARTIRLRNQWVKVDPRTWNSDMDATVMVGLGNGNKDQAMAHATNLLGIQAEMLKGGKADLVSDENLFHAAELYCKSADLKQTERYFTDPKSLPPKPPGPPPDPKAIEAQAEAQRKDQAHAQDLALSDQKAQQDAALKQRLADQEFVNRQREHEQGLQHERDKQALAHELELARAAHQAGLAKADAMNKSMLEEEAHKTELARKAKAVGLEDKMKPYIDGTEPEDDVDLKVAEGMQAIADAMQAQNQTISSAMSALAQGQVRMADAIAAMAAQAARPKRLIRDANGVAQGVEMA